jgi:hypothetical protein
MTYIITMQPPMLPQGEYTYACSDIAHLKRTVSAFKTLSVEIIDVEHAGKSLTQEEFSNILAD